MQQDFESAAWANNHHHLSAGITRLFRSLAYVFQRLNAIEYEAPWERVRPTRRPDCRP